MNLSALPGFLLVDSRTQGRRELQVYARYFEQEPVYEFLHDLKTDPDQLVNLAADPGYSEILVAKKGRCDELKES
jgi:hypothetical protein